MFNCENMSKFLKHSAYSFFLSSPLIHSCDDALLYSCDIWSIIAGVSEVLPHIFVPSFAKF